MVDVAYKAETGGDVLPPYLPIAEVEAVMATPLSECLPNVEKTFERKLLNFASLPEGGKPKGSHPVALVAGGPSLKKTIHALRNFDTVCVAGSAHDYIVSQGIKPRYAVVCDPMEDMVDYYSTPLPTCTYLIASHCHQNMFDQLQHSAVSVWHQLGLSDDDAKHFRGEPMVAGGCTAALRAISILIYFGYRNIHFFGLDCSFPSVDEHHAYDAKETHETIEVVVGNENGKKFLTTSGWVAQAQNFQKTVEQWGHLFTATVHGDSMLAEMIREGNKQTKPKESEA